MVEKAKAHEHNDAEGYRRVNAGVNDIVVDSEALSRRSSVDEVGTHQTPNEHEARHHGGEGDSNVEDRP